MSYSQAHGTYIRNNLLDKLGDDSSVYMRANPYAYMNEKNAIMLNCKDQNLFQEVYEKAVENHFKKQVGNTKPVLKIQGKDNMGELAESMGFVKFEIEEDDEEDDDDGFEFNKDEEEKQP